MQASGITREQLEQAATQVGVSIETDSKNQKGTRHRVKLYPSVPASAMTKGGRRRKGEAGDAPYQRTSASIMFYDNRRVHAVCWHGFRDFFRACFEQEPNAVFRTALDTWKGSEDFEARFAASGHKNIGSQVAPCFAAEACRCGEEGYAG